MSLSHRVANYLSGLLNIRNVRPCTVTIQREVFHGARYTSVHRYDANMAACVRGDAIPGQEYTEDHIYLVGTLPKCKQQSKSTCFVYENCDWYLACSYQKEKIPDEVKQFHPFGKTFILMPWTLEQPIDYGGRFEYKRVPLVVNYLSSNPAYEDSQVGIFDGY